MKQVFFFLCICSVFIILQPLGAGHNHSHDHINFYQPREATIQDNIYNVTAYPSFQWYYLDAMLNDNYSIHIGMVTIGAQSTKGFFLFRINLYKDSEIIEAKHKLVPLKQLTFSQEEPSILLGNEHILVGSINNQGQLVTNVSMIIDSVQVDLSYIGETQGWIGYTGKGFWGCPLPKAQVVGTITRDDETIQVTGVGYQEHGWNIHRLHRKWYWGKFSTNSTNVIFSQNMKNRWQEDLFLVMVNHEHNNFTSIKRENIELTHETFKVSHGRYLPISSRLIIDQEPIHIDAEIIIDHIHFTTLIFMSHWRFHAKIMGAVTIGESTETLDDYQIMEVFTFP